MGEIIDYQKISICNAILVRYTNYWTKNGGKNDIFSAIWQLNVEQNYKIAKLRKLMLLQGTGVIQLDIYFHFQYFPCPK